jgi:hypothetical protein
VIRCVVHTMSAMTIYILIIPPYIYLLSQFLFFLSCGKIFALILFFEIMKEQSLLGEMGRCRVLPGLRGSCLVRQKKNLEPVAASWLCLLAHQNTQINIKIFNQKNSVHTSNWCMECANYCLETPNNLEWNANLEANTTNFKTRGSLKLFSECCIAEPS